MKNVIAFFVGVIFAIGLGISGMTNPGKVLAFLDITGGKWDPSLAFVMIGAIGFNIVAFRLILKRDHPILEEDFSLPKVKDIDKKLLSGALIFGIGWGIGGFCPGPAIANIASLQPPVFIFFISMVGGALLFQTLHSPSSSKKAKKSLR